MQKLPLLFTTLQQKLPLVFTLRGKMRRIALDHLHTWKNKYNRKPMILRGARQVGKSYLVRSFAEVEKMDLLEINLELEPEKYT